MYVVAIFVIACGIVFIGRIRPKKETDPTTHVFTAVNTTTYRSVERATELSYRARHRAFTPVCGTYFRFGCAYVRTCSSKQQQQQQQQQTVPFPRLPS